MERDTIKLTWKTWDKAMFIHITQTNIHSCSLTSTIWRLCLTQQDQNKYHLITKPCQEVEEVSFSFSSTSVPSTPFQEWEDGLTTNGSEVWSGITNSWSLSIWVTSKSDTLPTSWDPNGLFSTTSTQDMKPNNSVHNGLMLLRKTKWVT